MIFQQCLSSDGKRSQVTLRRLNKTGTCRRARLRSRRKLRRGRPAVRASSAPEAEGAVDRRPSFPSAVHEPSSGGPCVSRRDTCSPLDALLAIAPFETKPKVGTGRPLQPARRTGLAHRVALSRGCHESQTPTVSCVTSRHGGCEDDSLRRACRSFSPASRMITVHTTVVVTLDGM